MSWNAFLLAGIGVFSSYKLGRITHNRHSLKYLAYTIALLFFTFSELSILFDSILAGYELTIYSGQLSEWFNIIAISFVLCGLAILIRESKPVFAQFPLIYTALPLLLIISYWLVNDTLAIKEWLITIYQGGALLVAILMYGVLSYRKEQYRFVLAATGLFLVTFLLYWFVPGVQAELSWVWQLLLGLSLLAGLYGLEYSLGREEPETAIQM